MSIWRRKSRSLSPTVAESIARSGVALSRTSLGGCVVLVGEDDIQDLLHPQRFAWSAPLFDGLLEALFAWRATSLGAVVVRGDGLITYRQAFLPFATEREAVTPSTWGTRHLTALTLTERCDAIAVVTSEQSGDVTVFEGDAWTTTDFPKLDDEPSWNDMQARVYETILDAWRRRGS